MSEDAQSPSLFPLYKPASRSISDGTLIKLSKFCRKKYGVDGACQRHYDSLRTAEPGYHQCPYGFTTRTFSHEQQRFAVTGVVAFPRFGSALERERAKSCADVKTSREAVDANVLFLQQAAAVRANVIECASKVLPQAFHELRKLNGAVLQHAEREIRERGESRSLLSIKSAAELMRNNFDILEALSNIEGIRALRNDSTINVFDLVYKMKRVFEERAAERDMTIQVGGVRAIVWGSQKSFPIVPAVLIENAIKYGESGSVVRADIGQQGRSALLIVENRTLAAIDPVTCFERGVRFSPGVEGGGFGLFLAREVIACHQGRIRCEVEGGTVRMIVELPLHTVIPMNT